MKKMKDLTGKRFGKWTVVSFAGRKEKQNGTVILWNCVCDCGNKGIVPSGNLLSGNSTNCGCERNTKIAEVGKNKGKQNSYSFLEDIGYGCLSNSDKYFLFDKEDFNKIKDICWYLNDRGYVQGRIKGGNKKVLLHHIVLDYNGIIDHQNRNKLDCRKENLCISSPTDNRQNSSLQKSNKSGCAGVKWNKATGKWSADITYHKERIYLGLFNSKEEAIMARLAKEAELCDNLLYRTNTPLLIKYGFI